MINRAVLTVSTLSLMLQQYYSTSQSYLPVDLLTAVHIMNYGITELHLHNPVVICMHVE